MIASADAAIALTLGLAGAGHCLGMCGGIAAALSLGGTRSLATTLAYHGGRIASYSMLGGLLGLIAGSINLAVWTLTLRFVAGFLLVAMGLYIADLWRGMLAVEKLGARLWRPVQGLSKRWLPVRRPSQALALGLAWGLMPCGLIYSSLAWAATAGDAATSAALMALFGVGTLPAMLATSLGARWFRDLLKRHGFRLGIGVVLICAGAWSLWHTTAHAAHMIGSFERAAAGERDAPAPAMHRHR